MTGRGTSPRTSLVVAGAALLLLTGCAGRVTAAVEQVGQTSVSSPTPVVTVPPTDTPAAADTGPPAAVGATPCTGDGLRVEPGPGQGAAGHDYLPVHFTNTGLAPCTLSGYPAVRLLSTDGAVPIGPAAARQPGQSPAVVLAPGHGATATLSIARAGLYPDCTAVPAGALSVGLPDGGPGVVVQLAAPVPACPSGSAAQSTVTAVLPD